jgi:hypothetical protein
VGEHAAELERRHFLLQLGGLAPDLLERGPVVIGARQAKQLRGIGQAAADPGQGVDQAFERLLLLAELLRSLLVVPELRVFQLAVQRLEAPLLRLEVKDTSAARQTVSAGPRDWRRSDSSVLLPLSGGRLVFPV